MVLDLHTPLTDFPGVGPARGKKLAKLGLTDVESLLTYYPRDYEDRRRSSAIRSAPEDVPVCVRAMVAAAPRLNRIRRGLELVKARVVDATGTADVTWFNQSWMKDALRPGEEYVFFGRLGGQGGRRRMTNPVVQRPGDEAVTGCILPVYPLTAGITNHLMVRLARQAVEACAERLPETLPQPVRREHRLAAAEWACRQAHFPDSFETLAVARRRLVFEELFYLSAGLALLRGRRTARKGWRMEPAPVDGYQRLLPYPLTGAQRQVMEDISGDMAGGRPMNRLVQGDVGSGKTAVAGYAAWMCAQNGGQTALMVPTELLAEQHFRSLSALLEPAGVRVGLLTGSLRPAEKKELHRAIAAGEVDLVIGTHALLSQGVRFPRLGLVVADEQHRFGVEQRALLAGKGEAGESPHILVMSATPIPRTLALIVYGDLDVSVIRELPPGRRPVATYLIGEDKRQRMYNFIRKLTGEGRQVYIVCPAVEEGAGDPLGPPLKAATAYAGELQRDVFPDLTVGCVHGRMKPRDKEAVMSAFARGELQVLVSTTVVEVGVDVPNAALMVVEDADRFGLSQLHQLRGRVGRGSWQSYCVLLTRNTGPETLSRLRAFTATTDGFRIAEEDLRLRGPGDFFGQRQHGLPQLKVASLAEDVDLLREAQDAARALLAGDPELARPEHRPVLERIRALFAEEADAFN